jgi:hypothetical protein
MAIDHEAHKIRIKAVSDRMNHPMTYNDAGAPKANEGRAGNALSKKKMGMEQKARDREYIVGGR